MAASLFLKHARDRAVKRRHGGTAMHCPQRAGGGPPRWVERPGQPSRARSHRTNVVHREPACRVRYRHRWITLLNPSQLMMAVAPAIVGPGPVGTEIAANFSILIKMISTVRSAEARGEPWTTCRECDRPCGLADRMRFFDLRLVANELTNTYVNREPMRVPGLECQCPGQRRHEH